MEGQPKSEEPVAIGFDADGRPCLFELPDGNFAVLGTDRTEELEPKLPSDAGAAPYERIVNIPRQLLTDALENIPKE